MHSQSHPRLIHVQECLINVIDSFEMSENYACININYIIKLNITLIIKVIF
jgi:hypothetical protein